MERSKHAVLGPSGQFVDLEGGEISFGGHRAEQRVRPFGSGGGLRGCSGWAWLVRRTGGGDTTGAQGPQLTRARTPRGRSPDRRPLPTDSRTAHRAVSAGLVLRPEDRGSAAGGAGRPHRGRGGAAGQVRLCGHRGAVADRPSGQRWLGRWFEVLPATAVKPGRSPIALRVGLDDGAGFDITEMGTEKRVAVGGPLPRRGHPPRRTGHRPAERRVHRGPSLRTARARSPPPSRTPSPPRR